jgi:hypothetical protein
MQRWVVQKDPHCFTFCAPSSNTVSTGEPQVVEAGMGQTLVLREHMDRLGLMSTEQQKDVYGESDQCPAAGGLHLQCTHTVHMTYAGCSQPCVCAQGPPHTSWLWSEQPPAAGARSTRCIRWACRPWRQPQWRRPYYWDSNTCSHQHRLQEAEKAGTCSCSFLRGRWCCFPSPSPRQGHCHHHWSSSSTGPTPHTDSYGSSEGPAEAGESFND